MRATSMARRVTDRGPRASRCCSTSAQACHRDRTQLLSSADMSDGDIVISGATAEDLPAIRQLLITNDLPTNGIEDHWKTFIVARDGEAIVGCGGSEAYKFAALIRSVAVADSHRGRG